MATETEQIQQLYWQLLKAWDHQTASEFAENFLEDGKAIGFDGSPMNGQKAIETSLQEIFSSFPTGSYVGVIERAALFSADCGIVHAVAGMVPRGGDDINPAVNAIQTLTAVKISGRWRIACFQNTPAAFHGRPELANELSARLRRALKARQN